MRKSAKVGLWALLICIGVAGLAIGLVLLLSSPQQIAKRKARRRAALEHDQFIARFDSLSKARLYPIVWRAGTFVKTRFDGDRQEWTLTISSRDWSRRNRGSKLDLATKLYTSFCAVITQAGGNPEDAVLLIEDEQCQRLAKCSRTLGTRIYK